MPEIYPCEPLDTTDKRYLNFALSTVVAYLKNSLYIYMYNDKFFGMDSKVFRILNDTPINSINCADFEPHKDMLTAKNHSKFRVMM